MRAVPTWQSSSVKSDHFLIVDDRKSGGKRIAHSPVRKEAVPSRMKSHLHPDSPWTPSKPATILAASKPENAVARTRPE